MTHIENDIHFGHGFRRYERSPDEKLAVAIKWAKEMQALAVERGRALSKLMDAKTDEELQRARAEAWKVMERPF